jgi:hypothetical protein
VPVANSKYPFLLYLNDKIKKTKKAALTKNAAFFMVKIENGILYFVFIGGKSNALDSCSKLLRCEPSQKGLLEDNPQRQSPKAVLPSSPYTIPSQSIISKSPSILIDPLLLIISFVLLIMLFIFLRSKIAKYMLSISHC